MKMEFYEVGTRIYKPYITISKSNCFMINSFMGRKLLETKGIPKYAKLGYGEDKKYIYVAIKLYYKKTNYKEPRPKNTLKVSKCYKDAFIITGWGFIKYHKINIKKYYGKYTPKEIMHEKLGKLYLIKIPKQKEDKSTS